MLLSDQPLKDDADLYSVVSCKNRLKNAQLVSQYHNANFLFNQMEIIIIWCN